MLQSTKAFNQSPASNKLSPMVLRQLSSSEKSYSGKLKSFQFVDRDGKIKNGITHIENGKNITSFDRVVLGGHEPSHHFSAGLLKMIGAQTGRIFGVWNENTVSAFLAGTRVYPQESYSYKTIDVGRRDDFIKHNYFFLNLKHLSERNDFQDPEKVILTNPDDKQFWESELPKIIPDALPSVPALTEAAWLFNETGHIIEKDYPQIFDQAVVSVNGSEKYKEEFERLKPIQHGQTFLLETKGQGTQVSHPISSTTESNNIQGIIDWEINPMDMRSEIIDAGEVILSISDATRDARMNNRDMTIDDIKASLKERISLQTLPDLSELDQILKEKYPTKEKGINPTQVLRQSIALDVLKYLDPSAKYHESSEYNIFYDVNQDAASEISQDERISNRIEKVNKIYKELPMWIRRSTYYLPKK